MKNYKIIITSEKKLGVGLDETLRKFYVNIATVKELHPQVGEDNVVFWSETYVVFDVDGKRVNCFAPGITASTFELEKAYPVLFRPLIGEWYLSKEGKKEIIEWDSFGHDMLSGEVIDIITSNQKNYGDKIVIDCGVVIEDSLSSVCFNSVKTGDYVQSSRVRLDVRKVDLWSAPHFRDM